MANNYSNLKNSYMYGYNNRLNNYYQNYKNFSNDLEDPIFTGFTFYINMVQSPLFNGGTLYASSDGSVVNSSSLASKIENSLKSKNDNKIKDYEETISNIEKFTSSQKIGYGNQSKVYSEGFDYNAIEYIYMVDKYLAPDSFSSSTSSFSSSERAIKPKSYEQSESNEVDLEEELNNKKEEYNNKSEEYINSQNEKFNKANEEYNLAKKEYDDLIDKINKKKALLNTFVQTEQNKNEIKEEINVLYNKLYGAGGCESRASDDSVYKTYIEKKDVFEKLRNSKENNELASISEDINSSISNNENNKNVKTLNDNTISSEQKSSDVNKQETSISNEGSPSINNYVASSSTPNSAPQTCVDLIGFINGMDKITKNYPYIFQSVTGLDEAYKNHFKMSEPYQGSGENKIVINCYESVDMRISSMFNRYFNAAYDREHKRERLPMNLRRFNCSIFVHDIRNFRHALNLITKQRGTFKEDNDSTNESLITEVALNHLSVVEFKFFDCEILQEETGGIFDTINNADLGEQRMTKFAFKYGNCFINFLPFEDLITFYRTNGSNNDLANESNIVYSTRKTKGTKNTQQTTDFKERESSISKSNVKKINDIKLGGVYEDIDEGEPDYSVENINEEIDVYESQRYLGDIEGDNSIYGLSKYLGNVEFDDYDEYLNMINHEDYNTAKRDYIDRTYADNFALNNADSLYEENRRALEVTMRGISASTGYTTSDLYNKFGLGNVYKKDDSNKENKLLNTNDVSQQEEVKYLTINDKITIIDDYVNKHEAREQDIDVDKRYLEIEDNKEFDYSRNIDYEFSTDYKIDNSSVLPEFKKNVDGEIDEYNTVTKIYSEEEKNASTKVIETIEDLVTNDVDEEIEIVESIGNTFENENIDYDDISNDLGNTINDNINDIGVNYNVEKIDENISKPIENKKIGSLNFETSTDGDYKSEENAYDINSNKVNKVSDIGKLVSKTKSNGNYNTIEKVYKKTKESDEVVRKYKEVEKLKDIEVFKSNKLYTSNDNKDDNFNLGNVISENIHEYKLEELGKINSHEKEYINEYKSEKTLSDDEKINIIKSIGNIEDKKEIDKNKLNNLNDLIIN